MLGCLIFTIGVIMEIISTTIPLMAAGRFIAGLGVGFESAVVILYMSEICPRKVRGALIACYQFCITIGILLASVVVYATQNRMDSGSYRIPVAIQLLWALILGVGIFFLPESPRYFVKKGEHEKAAKALASVRGQPEDSQYVTEELAEIIANHEYELSVVPQGSYFSSWANCFKGSLWKANSNLRRTILGTSLQMMQQWTGVNFIFFFGTTFFQQLVSLFLFSFLENNN
jgi:MFS family permease